LPEERSPLVPHFVLKELWVLTSSLGLIARLRVGTLKELWPSRVQLGGE
jgi:hypothetical protein